MAAKPFSQEPLIRQGMYLDIETTGLSPSKNQVTTIVWWSAEHGWGHWVAGVHPPAHFQQAWQASTQLITYNGKRFDEPFLEQHLGVAKHRQHLDLCQEGHRRGLKGGLKKICDHLQIRSPAYLNEVGGRDAVLFWQRYQRTQDAKWLQRLLHYNAWDVVMTYRLHQVLLGQSPAAIEVAMPFVRV